MKLYAERKTYSKVVSNWSSKLAACWLESQSGRNTLTYYSNNIGRMRYDQFRAANLLIGSDIIESGCKQLVTQRLKLPGAQWHLDGALLTAKARAAWTSGEWQKLVSARSLLPLAA